ncbi:MAG: hypothetical protein ACKOAG_04805 [Candidatus Kapaibacterium sp.]
MYKRIVLLASLVFVVPVFAQKGSGRAPNGSSAPQRLRVAKGDSFEFSTVADVENRVTMMGSEQVTTMSSSMKSRISVLSGGKDSAVLAMRIRNLEVAMKGMAMMGIPDTTVRRDSVPSGSEEVTVSTSGKVLGRKERADDETDGDADNRMLRQVLGNGSMTRGLLIPFPDKVLSAGDEWTDVRNDTVSGEQTMISNIVVRYTYEGTCDTLGMKCGRIKARSEKYVTSGTIKRMGGEMSMEGDGVVKATYLFELKTGVPVAVASTTETDQRLSVGEGMEIPISTTTSTRIVRVK